MSRARTLLLAAALAGGFVADTVPAAAQRIAPAPMRAAARPAPPSQPPADAWLGEDKVQHFAASAAVTALAYGGARIVLDEPDDARLAALGAAAVAGLLKEIHDSRRTFFSVRDLVWDALGMAAGYFWIREIE